MIRNNPIEVNMRSRALFLGRGVVAHFWRGNKFEITEICGNKSCCHTMIPTENFMVEFLMVSGNRKTLANFERLADSLFD
jgi:hypothetical protein